MQYAKRCAARTSLCISSQITNFNKKVNNFKQITLIPNIFCTVVKLAPPPPPPPTPAQQLTNGVKSAFGFATKTTEETASSATNTATSTTSSFTNGLSNLF